MTPACEVAAVAWILGIIVGGMLGALCGFLVGTISAGRALPKTDAQIVAEASRRVR